MVAREGLAVVAHLVDALRRLDIPVAAPTAGPSGAMTIGAPRRSDLAVIVLKGIVHLPLAHRMSVSQRIVLLAIALHLTGLSVTGRPTIAIQEIVHPAIVLQVLVLQVIGFR